VACPATERGGGGGEGSRGKRGLGLERADLGKGSDLETAKAAKRIMGEFLIIKQKRSEIAFSRSARGTISYVRGRKKGVLLQPPRRVPSGKWGALDAFRGGQGVG